jgi:pimeloyl-ACP methyl ester carboxylesterase
MNKAENKGKSTRGRKIKMVLLIILGVYVGITLISTVVNQILSGNELAGIEPTGQMVEVGGKMMHLRSMGNGEHTIVILPGLGTALPSTSFAPLMRELATEYTVVIIDYFGTGFSDRTDVPRTNANVVEELRSALSAGGFSPPFILMPHSASGATADYFTIRHPDEVTALVLLDTVHTHEHLEPNIGGLTLQAMRFSQFVGSPRLVSRFMLSTHGITEENGFTPEEIRNIRLFMNHEVNPTTLNRSRLFNETIHEVVALDFPQDIPVLSIRPTRPNPGSAMTRPENNEAHMRRYGEGSQMIILEGNHNIHKGNHVQIREAINTFLDEQQ